MKYKNGYKYQLSEDETTQTGIKPRGPIDTEYIDLQPDGTLTIKEGYAWDGASWAIDTKTFMRGSLVHDALYQLMREKLIDQEHRKAADELLRAICLEDGMWKIRAWWVYQGVRFGGGPAADPENEQLVLTAP